jgi:cytochrome P450
METNGASSAESAQPAFHRQRLVAMTSAMADAIDTMLARWQQFAAAGEQFNLQAEVSRMTVDVIGRTLAGQDLLPHAERVAAAMVSTFGLFRSRVQPSFQGAPVHPHRQEPRLQASD